MTPVAFTSATTPVEKQNECGVSAGGPIRKNRIFAFGNYDRYTLRSGSSPSLYSIPTTAERQGDFSALLGPQLSTCGATGTAACVDANGAPIMAGQIEDPASTVCTPGLACVRTPFPGNVIPTSRFSSVSSKLAAALPSPINGNVVNNYLGSLTGGTNQMDYTLKGDVNLTEKMRFYVMTQYGDNTNPALSPNGGPVLPLPYTSSRFGSTKTFLDQFNTTYTVSPSVVNVFGFGWNRFYTPFINPTTGGGWAAKVGLTGLPPGQASDTFPDVGFGGPDAPTVWASNGYTESFFDNAMTFTGQDNLQWIHGKHSVTVGFQVIDEQENTATPSGGGNVGGLNFSNTEVAGIDATTGSKTFNTPLTGAGNSYASYLLGELDSASVVQDSAGTVGARYKFFSTYVQDDIKWTPKLTINLGVRWTIPKPYVEDFNRNSFLNPTLPNSEVGGYAGALEFYGYGPDSCQCRTNVQTHFRDIAPRIGFAYQISNKTVIRGSYGTFYYNAGALGGNAQSSGVNLLGYSASPYDATQDSGITPAFEWDNGFPAFAHAPFFSSTINTGYNTSAASAPGGVGYGDPKLGGIQPRTQNWNLTVERELSPSTVIKVSYAASNSHYLPTGIGRGIWSGQLNPEYLPLAGLLTTTETPTSLAAAQAIMPQVQLPYANFAGAIGQMLLPFPQYAGIGDNFEDMGNGNYNSLQIAAQRHFAHGLQFLISYTLSREMDDAGSNLGGFFGAGGRTAYNNKLEKAVGNQDIPEVLVLSYVYALPAGKGHYVGGNSKVADAILGHWQFSGIQSYTQGTPTNAIGAVSCTVPYTGGCYADYTPGFTGPVKINGSYGSGGNAIGGTAYLNAAAFTTPAPYTFGDTPRNNAARLRNTTGLSENFSLMRDIKTYENFTIHIAFDAFNAFNRTQFNAPGTSLAGGFGQIGGQANAPRQFQGDVKIVF